MVGNCYLDNLISWITISTISTKLVSFIYMIKLNRLDLVQLVISAALATNVHIKTVR